MSKLTWYWHRLRAMGSEEVWGHVRKKSRQYFDIWSGPPASPKEDLECRETFPVLPDPAAAPAEVRDALSQDVLAILAGNWQAFGHLPIRVDDPPRWQHDYLAGVEVATDRMAFGLDHRQLPHGADIKMVWELSRWYQLTRLALASHVLGSGEAGRKSLGWLEDWVQRNPAYRGWNWTSALEVGMRLIQFCWIHACLTQRSPSSEHRPNLQRLAREILPAHVQFAWRYRSFGSSANNHLLGELAGLIQALVRWPSLERWAVPLGVLHEMWEQEVLRQFAEDGGNREQALNYHLFSFEFCWQTRVALCAAQRKIALGVEERLARAAIFYRDIQVKGEPWDYGDSDNACVTWLSTKMSGAPAEWRAWCESGEAQASPALHYWLGKGPDLLPEAASVTASQPWIHYHQTGQVMGRSDHWTLRWDVSPLGYLATAAHGHLDALHLSIWYDGIALVVDPGTGAYYVDSTLRRYLASWEAHNGPHPIGLDFPKRQGPFLWSESHAMPQVTLAMSQAVSAELDLPGGQVKRVVTRAKEEDGWVVEDQWTPTAEVSSGGFEVFWQFAPGSSLERIQEHQFLVRRASVALLVDLHAAWSEVIVSGVAEHPVEGQPVPYALRGYCAPAFRQRAIGPRLCLRSGGHNPCLLRTTFLACAD